MKHEILVPKPAPPKMAVLTVNSDELSLLKYAMGETYGGLSSARTAHQLIDELNDASDDLRNS